MKKKLKHLKIRKETYESGKIIFFLNLIIKNEMSKINPFIKKLGNCNYQFLTKE